MENKKIKKINFVYLLGYIFGPVILCAICFTLGMFICPDGGTMAVVLFMCPPLLSMVWWICAGRFLFKRKKKALEKELDEQGFSRNQTFYGDGCMVVIDTNKGNMALLFFWNPFEKQIFPVSRIEKAWVDDGRSGAGFLEGSSRVSFLFKVDGITVRVNTFTSNQRWRMDTDYILTGISKADMMVKVIEDAKKKVK
ncbi:MAG: hypothetical protein HFH31_04170 [Bacilli bacterium]|nr:hypothetical protein [Bacilli bacterium]